MVLSPTQHHTPLCVVCRAGLPSWGLQQWEGKRLVKPPLVWWQPRRNPGKHVWQKIHLISACSEIMVLAMSIRFLAGWRAGERQSLRVLQGLLGSRLELTINGLSSLAPLCPWEPQGWSHQRKRIETNHFCSLIYVMGRTADFFTDLCVTLKKDPPLST